MLLVSAESICRSLPGAEHPVGADELAAVVAALDAAVAGDDPVTVPAAGRRGRAGRRRRLAPRRGGDSIRVPTRRVHDLLDVVGEAELDVRRLDQPRPRAGRRWPPSTSAAARTLREPLAGAEPASHRAARRRCTRWSRSATSWWPPPASCSAAPRTRRAGSADVRDGAMGLAMVPVRRVVAGFPQLVRELAAPRPPSPVKDVGLVLTGQDVELDTRVLDAVADSLRHLVTNAVDHGCEIAGRAGRRRQARRRRRSPSRPGPPAPPWSSRSSDDGRGVDEDALRAAAVARGAAAGRLRPSRGAALLQVLFSPGFSTRDEVTQTSGRGVGLDVVRTVVEDLSGTIEVRAEPGRGHHVRDHAARHARRAALPDRPGRAPSATPLPVAGVVETLGLATAERHEVAGVPVLARDGRTMPLVDLGRVARRARRPGPARRRRRPARRRRRAAGPRRRRARGRARARRQGARRLPRPAAHRRRCDDRRRRQRGAGARRPRARRPPAGLPAPARRRSALGAPNRRTPATPPAPVDRPRVLVVEDSVGVRELQRVILEGAGYDVADRRRRAGRRRPAEPGTRSTWCVSDVEMPGMDGFTLTRTHPPDPRLGGRARRDHDLAGRRGRPAGRSGCRCQRLPAQERVRPGRTHRYGPPSCSAADRSHSEARPPMPTVLIADDSPTLRRIVSTVLERAGYTVVHRRGRRRGRPGRLPQPARRRHPGRPDAAAVRLRRRPAAQGRLADRGDPGRAADLAGRRRRTATGASRPAPTAS